MLRTDFLTVQCMYYFVRRTGKNSTTHMTQKWDRIMKILENKKIQNDLDGLLK